MALRVVSLILLLFLFQQLTAQKEKYLRGSIVDENSKPISKATIRLLKDNRPVAESLTQGEFKIDISGCISCHAGTEVELQIIYEDYYYGNSRITIPGDLVLKEPIKVKRITLNGIVRDSATQNFIKDIDVSCADGLNCDPKVVRTNQYGQFSFYIKGNISSPILDAKYLFVDPQGRYHDGDSRRCRKGDDYYLVPNKNIEDWRRKLAELLRKADTSIVNIEDPRRKLAKLLRKADTSMVLIPASTFQMGCPFECNSRQCQTDNCPERRIKIDSFWISKFEVTNEQFCFFLSNTHYDLHKDNIVDFECWNKTVKESISVVNGRYSVSKSFEDHPITCVSWYGAMAFCNWLNAQNHNQTTYRLPTEAEWELAAKYDKGHQNVLYAGMDDVKDINKYVNYKSDKGGKAILLRKNALTPNGIGLFSMSGNAAEWCNDWYQPYEEQKKIVHNPQGPSQGTYRVVRGGAWNLPKEHALVFSRDKAEPHKCSPAIGFRLAKN